MNSAKSKNISSPCISICKTDPLTGFCYGCARTNEEKKMWKEKNTTEKWKKENLNILIKRIFFFITLFLNFYHFCIIYHTFENPLQ